MRKIGTFFAIIAITFLLLLLSNYANAEAIEKETSDLNNERMHLYKNMELIYQIPWYYIAAIDQFERNINSKSNTPEEKNKVVGIRFTKEKWVGFLNPELEDQNPGRIDSFMGFGLDGDGDGKADRNNDTDAMIAFLTFISRYGTGEAGINRGLTAYYNEQSAKIITEIAMIYQKFNTLDLSKRVFPMDRRQNYSYRSTWGDTRGWGGVRIHEGTDIFASYGVPVKSVAPGYVEVLGWNKYGGWRIGIRGTNNIYYYYAHLSGYKKDLKEGDIVNAGDVIGYVGSSGYGTPGTQGKFPPHLHFGMYKFYGRYEWAFDPTPYLRRWERNKN